MKKSHSHASLVIGLLVSVLVVGAFFVSPLGSATFTGMPGNAPTLGVGEDSGDSSATVRAHDEQRQSDLQQIATALEFYASEHDGGFPNSGGCAKMKLQNKLGDYLTVFPEDPTGLLTTTVVLGACGVNNGGGYGYIPLNTNSVNSYAEGYLLVARAQSSSTTGDSGVYYNTSAWTPTVTGSNAKAAYNLASATKCTSTTTACTSTVSRYYMIGR